MSLTSLVKRILPLACAYYLAAGWARRRRLRSGIIRTRSGNRHAALDVEASLAYIEGVWRDYLAWADRPALTGDLVEIGPGDNFGVALLFLAHGARSVIAIDKFESERDPARQDAIYRALGERHGLAALFDGAPGEAAIRNLTYLPGMPAERFFGPDAPASDAVISRAVLEHLDDPLAALDAMWAGLRPGGILLHRIDLRDHGMFAGAHPLSFLTIGTGLYRAMTAETGWPNRILLPAYRDFLARRGWPARTGITRLAGVAGEFPALAWDDLPAAARQQALACVRKIRPRLAAPFRDLADEDLAVSGFVLVAEKPPAGGPG
ncbi:methyltransferase domain-containing protein [Ferrovibrio sp.]|uniref:class I SAM-dependent methyltransferase n=1 Tax=Ferrovibrio sp. TaxID=1917215 RepID=UPI00311D4B5B